MIHIIQIFTSTIKNGKKITNKPRISPRCTRSPVSRGSTAAGSARLGHAPLRAACLGGWQAKPRVGAAGGQATRRGPGMRWRGPGRYAPPTPTCPAHSAPACPEPRACARPRGGAAHRPPPLCQACAGARPRPRLWQAVRRRGSPAPARTWESGREEAEGGREEEAFVGGWLGGDVEGERKKIRLRERRSRRS